MFLKYCMGDDGYYRGAVLKPGEQGIIQYVVRRPGGEWAAYKSSNGDRWIFPIWNHFPCNHKTSLAELTQNEFDDTMQRLSFLPEDAKAELSECFIVLKAAYRFGFKAANIQ